MAQALQILFRPALVFVPEVMQSKADGRMVNSLWPASASKRLRLETSAACSQAASVWRVQAPIPALAWHWDALSFESQALLSADSILALQVPVCDWYAGHPPGKVTLFAAKIFSEGRINWTLWQLPDVASARIKAIL